MTYPSIGWKNKGGTSDREAPGGSWKSYWESQSREQWPLLCCVENCRNFATDGAHMYCPSKDRREWIIPVCHFHNMQYDAIYNLKNSTPSTLVSANVSE